MYKFLFIQWVEGKINEQQIYNAKDKGYITQAEADEILATPQRRYREI